MLAGKSDKVPISFQVSEISGPENAELGEGRNQQLDRRSLGEPDPPFASAVLQQEMGDPQAVRRIEEVAVEQFETAFRTPNDRAGSKSTTTKP